jgi:hypothetical protein
MLFPTQLDSDGFLMNHLEDGTLGYPVLAGDLVLGQDGRRASQVTADGPQAANTPPARLKRHC